MRFVAGQALPPSENFYGGVLDTSRSHCDRRPAAVVLEQEVAKLPGPVHRTVVGYCVKELPLRHLQPQMYDEPQRRTRIGLTLKMASIDGRVMGL